MYKFANTFFFFFHTVFIVFNIFGWMFKSLRVYNLATLSITAFSWFVLGIWYGWGYCWCTDWHWQVREKLGYTDYTNSYIDFLIIQLTGINFSNTLVDTVTLVIFLSSLTASTFLNIRDFRQD